MAADLAKRELASMHASFEAAAPRLDGEDAGIAAIREKMEALETLANQGIAAGLANDDAGALVALRQLDPIVVDFSKTITALNEKTLAHTNAISDELTAEARATSWYLIGVTLAGAVAGLVASLWMSAAGITGPLNALRGRMAELAGGRLDVEIDGQGRGDEVGAMARAVQVFKDAALANKRLEAEAETARRAEAALRETQAQADRAKAQELVAFVADIEAGFTRLAAGDLTTRMERPVAPDYEGIRAQFNGSVEKLEHTIGAVVGSIGSIRTGLTEINVASNDLAQRTEQQAASLEETVAALGEVTRAVNETARDAEKARTSAESAQRNAERGGQIVGRAVEAMQTIEQSSQKIGSIISVIDEIAFQTNLLALNAGVEAARAGEAAGGSRWWRRRCGAWPSARRKPPRRSRA